MAGDRADVSSRQLGVLVTCASGQNDNDCFIAYNMHWVKHTFALPALPKKKKWYRVMDTAEGILERAAASGKPEDGWY